MDESTGVSHHHQLEIDFGVISVAARANNLLISKSSLGNSYRIYSVKLSGQATPFSKSETLHVSFLYKLQDLFLSAKLIFSLETQELLL